MQYIEIKRDVHRKLKRTTVESLIKFLSIKQLLLWGLKKTRNWVSKTIYITLYKYLFSIGYSALLTKIKRWYDVGSRTLAKTARRCFVSQGDGVWIRLAREHSVIGGQQPEISIFQNLKKCSPLDGFMRLSLVWEKFSINE